MSLVRPPNNYFLSDSTYTLTTSFVKKSFGFTPVTIWIKDDVDAAIFWSWDGTNVAGSIHGGESITITGAQYDWIYLKGVAGSESYRIVAY